MEAVLGLLGCVWAHLGLKCGDEGVASPLGRRRRGGPGCHPTHRLGWSCSKSNGVHTMSELQKPERPMTVDDLLMKLTSMGYVKGGDLHPPDINGFCFCEGPEDGVPHWRSRAEWQEKPGGFDFISVYPCGEHDEEGDTFVFVLFNPRNGVIKEWRIAEHWTGDDFTILNPESLEIVLKIHENWLLSLSTEPD